MQVFAGDTVGGDVVTVTHAVQITFPAGTDDYQVLIAGAPVINPRTGFTDTHFYEFDVAAADVK